MPPDLSIVLSFRNEEEVIPDLLARLHGALRPASLAYELIFVNDASTDRSLEILAAAAKADPAVKVVNMSRRFGVAPCVVAGFRHASGRAVAYMDADLQDPPEILPEMVRKWREGADVVYTTRRARAGEGRIKMGITAMAYRALAAVFEIRLPVDSGDFKLLSRRAIDRLLALQEKDPFLRGLAHWVGFRQEQILYDREPRRAGRTHFSLLRSLGPYKAFAAGLTSFSTFPLVVPLLAGIPLALLCGAGLGVDAILWATGKGTDPFLDLLLAIGLSCGLLLSAVGIVGLYLGRVLRESQNRPLYIVESTIGFDPPPAGEPPPAAPVPEAVPPPPGTGPVSLS